MTDKKGLSLVEILVVVAVVLVLMGILFPLLGKAMRHAREMCPERPQGSGFHQTL